MEEDIKNLEVFIGEHKRNYLNKKCVEKLINKLKENEAVIDEMAKFMNNRSWKEHQLKDEDCNCCKVEYGSDKCTECIKEYFRKKVKDERDKV